jgi:hypothetical protein
VLDSFLLVQHRHGSFPAAREAEALQRDEAGSGRTEVEMRARKHWHGGPEGSLRGSRVRPVRPLEPLKSFGVEVHPAFWRFSSTIGFVVEVVAVCVGVVVGICVSVKFVRGRGEPGVHLVGQGGGREGVRGASEGGREGGGRAHMAKSLHRGIFPLLFGVRQRSDTLAWVGASVEEESEDGGERETLVRQGEHEMVVLMQAGALLPPSDAE